MKEITQDNYKQLEFNWDGIIVAYPKVDLYWNAEFYVYKQELDERNEYIYKCCGYGKEDSVYNGFSGDWNKPNFESCFGNWDRLNYYYFEDLKDFCNWYLHKDDKLKKSIKEFKETTDKFYTQDEIRDKINPGWNTRREKLKDVLTLLELRDSRNNTINMILSSESHIMKEHLQKQLARDNERIEAFLDEVIV